MSAKTAVMRLCIKINEEWVMDIEYKVIMLLLSLALINLAFAFTRFG